MSEQKKDVKYLTSISLAVSDMDDEIRHVQFVVVQDVETKKLQCFFDVVDPSLIRLQDGEVSNSGNTD